MQVNAHVFNSKIIKEYDIRGKFNTELNEKDAYFLGCAFGTYLKNNNISKKICIGHDGRNSSLILKPFLIKGILKIGFDIIDLGLIPTSVLYYACHTVVDTSAGIMITASHNPKEYNGFKIVVEKKPFYGDLLKELCKIAASGKIKFSDSFGVVKSLDISKEYVKKITNPKTHSKEMSSLDLKIVWDICNGSVSSILQKVVQRLPGQHVIINHEVNGNFPSHPPDPTNEENLRQIKNVICSEKCDFGIAFDGDADRIVLINNKFRVFHGDELLAFFAHDLLKRNPNAKIVTDIKTSNSALNEIKKLGGNVITWKTGHSNIKNKMIKENALFGGEVSGHLFFKENYYGFDDALFAACKLIFLLKDKRNRKYFRDLPKAFVSSEIRVPCSAENKTYFIKKIKNILDDKRINYIALDGIRVENDKGWWLVRSSNTENSLVMRLEGYSEENFNFILNHLSNILQIIGIKNIPDKFLI